MDELLVVKQSQASSEKLSQLEKELEDIKQQAINSYQGKLTESPLREKANASQGLIKSQDKNLSVSKQNRPTYIEEHTLNRPERLEAFPPNKHALNNIFWVGIAVLALSLIVSGIILLTKIN